MKKKKILFFVLISLCLQIVIFLVLEWKAEQLLNPLYRYGKAYPISAQLGDSQLHRLSYNNRFLSCINNNNLEVIDLTSNNIIFRSTHDNAKVLSYQWLPDRNSLIYFIKQANNEQEIFLYSLDLDSIASVQNTQNIEPRLDRAITMSVSQIVDIEISTYTNNLYIMAANAQKHSELIKIDIMKNINRLDIPGQSISKIAVSNKYGIVFVQSTGPSLKEIVSFQGMDRKLVSSNPSEVLIGSNNEFLFTGLLDKNTLKEIYSTPVNDQEGKKKILWQGSIQYDLVKDIMVTENELLLKGNSNLDYINNQGVHRTKKLSSNIPVLSPTGQMYLELITNKDKAVYYWHSI